MLECSSYRHNLRDQERNHLDQAELSAAFQESGYHFFPPRRSLVDIQTVPNILTNYGEGLRIDPFPMILDDFVRRRHTLGNVSWKVPRIKMTSINLPILRWPAIQ